MKKNTYMDNLILAEVVVIGLAEAVHLSAIVLELPFHLCAIIFLGLLAAGLVPAVIGCLVRQKYKSQHKEVHSEESSRRRLWPEDRAEWVLTAIYVLLLLIQLLFICRGDQFYNQKDMTIETVGSFLATDGIYLVNPMTGLPYTVGIPSRLKILCLPTLYGSVCSVLGLSPVFVVKKLVPAIILLSSHAAFASLGRSLFPQGARKKEICFMIVVSLLLWAGTYSYGMDGFGLLYCGWRGVSIRNGVLLPWIFSLCIRKKWLSAFLCCLAEACIVWTFYGMGACFFVLVGMAISSWCHRKYRIKTGRLQNRKTADSFWTEDGKETAK